MPSEYKKLKGIERENLRDPMDDFELIFNMLGERATTEIHRAEDSKGVVKLKADAKAGGDTFEEANKNIKDAIDGYLAVLREDNDEIPIEEKEHIAATV